MTEAARVVQVGVEGRTLVDMLRSKSQSPHAHKVAYRFLVDGEGKEEKITFAQLDCRARAIAAHLQSTLQEGSHILLLFAPGLQFIVGFFGCLYGGFVAVPAYPPDPSRMGRTVARLQQVIQDADVKLVLSTRLLHRMASSFFASLAGSARDLPWAQTDNVRDRLADSWSPPSLLTSQSLAMMQYTSGSTSAPKGVMLSHANIVHNLSFIARISKVSPDERNVSWLPPYHDMGLISSILLNILVGHESILFSPIHFLQRPFRWLAAISRFRASGSAAPNFAFDLAVRKTSPAEKASLDLSSWRVAFNGAEPVRAATLHRFLAAFADCGLRPGVILPVYGLAECTLMATAPPGPEGSPVVRSFNRSKLAAKEVMAVPAEAEDGTALVALGTADEDGAIRIADPETGRECAGVGEVWLASSSVAQGYWGKPGHEAFVPRDGGGRWLRTGDLGFVHDGQLYVAGRLKNVVVVRGRNLCAEDIEHTVERGQSFTRRGCVAVFVSDRRGDEAREGGRNGEGGTGAGQQTGEGAEEALVVVAEIERRAAKGVSEGEHYDEVARAVRSAVAEEHGVGVREVAFVGDGSMLKTTSGKLQRQALKDAYERQGLELVHRSVVSGVGGAARASGGSTAACPRSQGALDGDGIAERHERSGGSGEKLRGAAELLSELEVEVREETLGLRLPQLGVDSVKVQQLLYALKRRGVSVEVPELLGMTLQQLLHRIDEQQSLGGAPLYGSLQEAGDSHPRQRSDGHAPGSESRGDDLGAPQGGSQDAAAGEEAVEVEVEAAAIVAVPAAVASAMAGRGGGGGGAGCAVSELLGGRPQLLAVYEAGELGRVGVVVAAVQDEEVYADPERTRGAVREAVELAGRLGAKVASLTGMIPSATEYGRAVVDEGGERWGGVRVTTGHATTAAACVLMLERLLLEGGRALQGEDLAVVGVGSIGAAVLQLALAALPHPRSLLLVDLPAKLEELHALRRRIKAAGFRGAVDVAAVGGGGGAAGMPASVFRRRCFFGASSAAANLLDVSRLRPGTLLLDDSAPHCFSAAAAHARLLAAQDILYSEAGAIRCPFPVVEVPGVRAAALDTALVRDALKLLHPAGAVLMGCVLSALLTARSGGLGAVIGRASVEESRGHLAYLRAALCQAAPLYCQQAVLDVDLIRAFRDLHGAGAGRRGRGSRSAGLTPSMMLRLGGHLLFGSCARGGRLRRGRVVPEAQAGEDEKEAAGEGARAEAAAPKGAAAMRVIEATRQSGSDQCHCRDES